VRTKLGIILPLAVGTISIPLIVWDIHNQRVIVSMGMAWDTGAPVWPYQTPDILLRFLSFPAYIFAMPIANWLRLWVYTGASFFVTAPLILSWWRLLGFWLDRGMVKQSTNRRWFLFSLLLVLGLMLSCAAVIASQDSFHWWSRYGSYFRSLPTFLMMMRFLTPAVWSIVLGIFVAVTAKKVVTRSPT
jgi:hypothetical protein